VDVATASDSKTIVGVTLSAIIVLFVVALVAMRRYRRESAAATLAALPISEKECFDTDDSAAHELEGTLRLPPQEMEGKETAELDTIVPRIIYEMDGGHTRSSGTRKCSDSSGSLQAESNNGLDDEGQILEFDCPRNTAFASPTSETPLEFYGLEAGTSSSRGWVGRIPEAPAIALIPATPRHL
jgi:hypothetical protein